MIRVEVERLKNLTSCKTTLRYFPNHFHHDLIILFLFNLYTLPLLVLWFMHVFQHVSNRSASKMSSSFSLFVGMIDTKVKPVRYAPQKQKNTTGHNSSMGATHPGPQSVLGVTFPSSSVTCSKQGRSWEDRLQREDYDGTPSWTESEQPAMNRIATCSLVHRNAYRHTGQ